MSKWAVVVELATAATPVILTWVTVLLRRIDKHLKRLDEIERTLFGEDKIEHDSGVVGEIQELREEINDG